ncbi:unnamed protein product [Mortierella alpina]
MTSTKSRYGATSPSHFNDDAFDRPWLNTYSRALCSLYHNEEDECWDVLLSSQCAETLAEQQDRASNRLHTPSSHTQQQAAAANNVSSGHGPPKHLSRLHEPCERPVENQTLYLGSTLSTSLPRESVPESEASGSSEVADQVVLTPMSPGGSLSHAFCSLGFSAIDYFTASEDDQASADRSTTAVRSGPQEGSLMEETHLSACSTTSDQVMEFNTTILEDQRSPNADWAAAVCGKRTAALERKRVLSRTLSQENGVSLNNQQDPWFETLDRLSRWDEVAYR